MPGALSLGLGLAGKTLLAGLGFMLLLLAAAAALRPDLSKPPAPHDPAEIAAVQAQRDTSFDASKPELLPRIQREVDYHQGKAAAWWPKGEAPVLAEMVKAGQLPPVAQRVGPEPVVMDGGEIGRYGGTYLRTATSDGDVFIVEYRLGYSGLFRWSPLGQPVVPHLATRMDESPDKREFIVHLRKGVRWSDGHPYSADDIMYWWKYEDTNTTVGDAAPSRWLVVGGGKTEVEKIDSHTVRFRFEHPYGNFKEVLASFSLVMSSLPAHYLRQYHPDTADPAFLAREMKALGISNPRSLYTRMKRFDNPECPRLWPWVLRSSKANPPYVYVRNPYYFAVDPKGNQLPYMDRLQFDVRSTQMIGLSFSNGEVTAQGRSIRYENYTELMSRQKEANFTLRHWYPASRSAWVIHPNLNRRVDPEQPDSAGKAALLADKRFRQALSLAIDRAAIIKAEYHDQVRPSQVEPGPQSPFHSPRLRDAFIQHDVARANALLDELGLTQRDVDGMRMLPGGGTLTFYLNFMAFTGLGAGQFVADDWAKVGIRAIPREQQRGLFYTKRDSGDFDFMVWSSESDFFPLLHPALFAPPDTESYYAVQWGRWFTLGGLYNPDAVKDLPNAQGPAPGSPMYRAYQAYARAQQAATQEEQVAHFNEVLDIAAENLWTINIAEAPPFLMVVNNDVHNVPKNALYSGIVRTPANAGIETYFFGHPVNNAVDDTRAQLTKVTPIPRLPAEGGTAAAGSSGGGWRISSVLAWLLWLVLGAGVLLVALRHPFIARRLAIMLPTLAVISVIVFVIIQLPPGDYLTSRLTYLQETGDQSLIKEAESLKETFHYDDPLWKQYLRWTGLLWFTSFDAKDTGLLQGDMGLSMETARPVNEMVGDRLLLTFLISLGTIVLTWAIAIPIGVFSAVRQYSAGDYLFTFIGFIGMSVPPFLLALVIMVLAGVSGLFSPEFAAQPQWSWAKFADLMAHIWVPVVVSAVSGTAGMIRIMRANLLDELKKPYVTTARAKGVPPLRLLFKYPVRIALNPFVSGIGHIFPQLVSGGAIVSIVLSLPTVGPLQVSALFNEDMYLAGSMLMALSLLAVLGTLVADLLLLWLDPRIRYEQAAA
jgi:ABC-type dipeptide/oligopeptide/nickel transport system permease component/ABC-type transport system substrate-binding protein